MKDNEKLFDDFHVISGDMLSKCKNEFVAAKNLKVCHDANPLKPLEIPNGQTVLMTRTILL